MILANFNSKEINKVWNRDMAEVEGTAHYFHHYQTAAESNSTYLTLMKVEGDSFMKQTLACIPGKRAELYVEVNGSLAYYPHTFDRYCERVLGITAECTESGVKWDVGIEERAARFIFDLKQKGVIMLGQTNESNPKTGVCNRGVAVMGNGLLMYKTDTPSHIPTFETYIDVELVSRFPDQVEAVRLAHEGKIAEALAAYNKYVEKKRVAKSL